MNTDERLKKALEKIEARKTDLFENGITGKTEKEYERCDFIAPTFRKAVRLLYPKSGAVLLGNKKREDIMTLTKDHPVIYAITHRGTFDVPRLLAHVLPHVYIISGDEKVFYCTINEHLLNVNGIEHFDRKDPKDSNLMIDRASGILKSSSKYEEHHAIMLAPEGVPNVYGRHGLKLYPGPIKMALNTSSYIIPVGNEINIIRNKKTDKIIGDINYMKYENYDEKSLFRPSDDTSLEKMHQYLKDVKYSDVVGSTKVDDFIRFGQFKLDNISFNLEEKMTEFLNTHPDVKEFVSKIDGDDMIPITEYLKKCSVVKDLNNRQIACLNILDERMKALSDEINVEIDKRHPKSAEEHEKNSLEYINYYLDNVEKQGKKGKSTAYNEIDQFINKTTDESILASENEKVLAGVKVLLRK